MADWGTLPVPKISAYSSAHQFRRISTPMESGPQRITRTSSHYMRTARANVVMTQAQNSTFEQLIADSNDGTDFIDNVPWDIGGGKQLVRARILSVNTKILRQGEVYEVSLQMETDSI